MNEGESHLLFFPAEKKNIYIYFFFNFINPIMIIEKGAEWEEE